MKISSRQSPLAQIQAYQVGETLMKTNAGLQIDYLFRQSLGDQNLNEPLWKMPEKGVFTEDFYKDLVAGATDLVVHSWKDLPTEEKEHTQIVATLPREDQRDLLLFKKSSLKKDRLRFFSSSPRRSFNLKPFLLEILPWKTEAIEFASVRGNISTRVQKLLEDPETDGLIVAKAALDRLLGDTRFPDVQRSLRQALEKLQWMVLPLSENPNAAAQGALAIEVNRKHSSVQGALAKINCEKSFQSALREREILKAFGGGCHLALGMSVLERSYGRIEIVKGLTPSGEKIHLKNFIPQKPRPSQMTVSRLEFQSERATVARDLPGDVDAFFISRVEAWSNQIGTRIVWTAGLQTWKKLAALGIWVHGSSEGLGESEDPRLETLSGLNLRWRTLGHEELGNQRLKTYRLDLKLLTEKLMDSAGFRWKSGSEFQLALSRFPELRSKAHFCGPGRTFQIIKKELGSDQNIFVELSDEFITVV